MRNTYTHTRTDIHTHTHILQDELNYKPEYKLEHKQNRQVDQITGRSSNYETKIFNLFP